MAEQIRKREEIEAKYKWNLSHIYATDEAWKADYERVQAQIDETAALNGTVAAEPKKAIRTYFALQRELLPIYEYAFLRKETDNADPTAQGLKDRAIRLLNWTKIDPSENVCFWGVLYNRLVECAAASGWKISVENAFDCQPEELSAELTGDRISRCIIAGAFVPDFAVRLKKRMKVCLELLPRHTCPVAMELRGASDMTVRQLDYLFSRGYRRIGYMYLGGRDVSRYPVQVLRLLDYYRLMAEKGYQVNPDWVFLLSDLFENFEIGMERMMNSDPKPEALIVPGGKLLPLLYPYCWKHKIKVGKDLAVFACDDIPGQNFPEVTTITNNPVEIAETFWEMFLAAERGEKVESRCTELLIRTGQTVPDRKHTVV